MTFNDIAPINFFGPRHPSLDPPRPPLLDLSMLVNNLSTILCVGEHSRNALLLPNVPPHSNYFILLVSLERCLGAFRGMFMRFSFLKSCLIGIAALCAWNCSDSAAPEDDPASGPAFKVCPEAGLSGAFHLSVGMDLIRPLVYSCFGL